MLVDAVNHGAGCSLPPKSVFTLSLQEDNPGLMASFLRSYLLHNHLKSGGQREESDEKPLARKQQVFTPYALGACTFHGCLVMLILEQWEET